jgi:sec-independent protein translocase protein TatA
MDILLTGFMMNPLTMVILLVIALLIFGKRLPEVARSLGKGIVEFKKGVKGIEEEVDRPLPYNPNQYSQPYTPGQPQGAPTYGQPPAPGAAPQQGYAGYPPAGQPGGYGQPQDAYGQYGQYGQGAGQYVAPGSPAPAAQGAAPYGVQPQPYGAQPVHGTPGAPPGGAPAPSAAPVPHHEGRPAD